MRTFDLKGESITCPKCGQLVSITNKVRIERHYLPRTTHRIELEYRAQHVDLSIAQKCEMSGADVAIAPQWTGA